jgi:hypothetical protein
VPAGRLGLINGMNVPRGAWVAAGALFVMLALVGDRYGFHRDEFYFIEGGHHPAWAQPDNPIVVPLAAAAWHDLMAGNLWAFRLLPAVIAGLTVLVAALTSQAFGGDRRHQTAAAVATAATAIVPATGHLFSITTFDILLTSATLLLLIRALKQPGRLGPWIVVGLVAGVALEVKVLLALVLFSCLLAMLVMGPRAPLAKPGPWLAALIAAVLAAPNLAWQWLHSWPMLAIARNIAAGGSVSSTSRFGVIYLHLLLVGPILAVVLITGLVVLVRRPALKPYAWITGGYVVFLVLVVASGGKPYYLAGFFPAVLAAGAAPVIDWVIKTRRRKLVAVGLLTFSSVVTAFLSLPLAPVGSAIYQIAVAVNPDAAETVGWDSYIATVRDVAATLPPGERDSAIILTRNYGEAGALSRARRLSSEDAAALPAVYSGHNAFADWGPPPESAATAIVVGRFDTQQLQSWFRRCHQLAQLTSPPRVNNEEDGAPVRICTGRQSSWGEIWPDVRRLA